MVVVTSLVVIINFCEKLIYICQQDIQLLDDKKYTRKYNTQIKVNNILIMSKKKKKQDV